MPHSAPPVISFDKVKRTDTGLVGGKNASLGEMIQALGAKGIRVPPGFATTADAYRDYLTANKLEARIRQELGALAAGRTTLPKAGKAIRALILGGDWPARTAQAILAQYRSLSAAAGQPDLPVAVRSSATAEDLPEASFAGQQETFLNVRGEQALLEACRKCYASLFTDRAISYRRIHGLRSYEGGAVGRGAADGARRHWRRRGDVLNRHRIRLSRCGADQRRLGLGRKRGAGRGGPGRIPGLQTLPGHSRPDPDPGKAAGAPRPSR